MTMKSDRHLGLSVALCVGSLFLGIAGCGGIERSERPGSVSEHGSRGLAPGFQDTVRPQRAVPPSVARIVSQRAEGDALDVRFTPDGRRALAVTNAGEALLLNRDGTLVARRKTASQAHHQLRFLSFDQSGSRALFAFAGTFRGFLIWDLHQDLWQEVAVESQTPLSSGVIVRDQLWWWDGRSRMYLRDLQTGDDELLREDVGLLLSLQLSASGRYLYLEYENDHEVLDTTTREVAGHFGGSDLRVRPGGGLITTRSTSGAVEVMTPRGSPRGRVDLSAVHVGFTPRQRLAVVSETGVHLFDPEGLRRRHELAFATDGLEVLGVTDDALWLRTDEGDLRFEPLVQATGLDAVLHPANHDPAGHAWDTANDGTVVIAYDHSVRFFAANGAARGSFETGSAEFEHTFHGLEADAEVVLAWSRAGSLAIDTHRVYSLPCSGQGELIHFGEQWAWQTSPRVCFAERHRQVSATGERPEAFAGVHREHLLVAQTGRLREIHPSSGEVLREVTLPPGFRVACGDGLCGTHAVSSGARVALRGESSTLLFDGDLDLLQRSDGVAELSASSDAIFVRFDALLRYREDAETPDDLGFATSFAIEPGSGRIARNVEGHVRVEVGVEEEHELATQGEVESFVGNALTVRDPDRMLSVWRVQPATLVARIDNGRPWALSSSGEHLALCGANGRLTVMNIDSGELEYEFGDCELYDQIRFAFGDRILAVNAKTHIALFRLRDGAWLKLRERVDRESESAGWWVEDSRGRVDASSHELLRTLRRRPVGSLLRVSMEAIPPSRYSAGLLGEFLRLL